VRQEKERENIKDSFRGKETSTLGRAKVFPSLERAKGSVWVDPEKWVEFGLCWGRTPQGLGDKNGWAQKLVALR
jgi:hypothetical protein